MRADLQTDRANCGACGYECLSTAADACRQGVCRPALQGCFDKDTGPQSCDEYCVSIGETCAARACDGNTWRSWDAGDAGPKYCEKHVFHDGQGPDGCSVPIRWDASYKGRMRCCCTDTR